KGRAVGPGPRARAARGRARARTRTARRTDARLRGARAARLSAVAGRARPRRGVAHGGTPGRDARRDGSRARGGRRAGALGRIGALMGSIPDLARVRDFLRQWCDAEVAVDGGAMVPVLEAALAARTGHARVADVAVHVVRYKPERKCVLRYDLTWAGGAAPSRPAVVYAKVARRAKFERTQHILGRIRAADDGLGFELPEPLGTLPELCMEFFSHLPGVPLSTLVTADAFPRLCERVAVSLLHFHALPVTLGWERGVAANVAKVTDRAAEFATLFPGERQRIAAIRGDLRARLGAMRPSRLRLTHGDFQGDNILIDGARIGLVDLEDCAMGDPADDVGSNWAQLTWHTVKAGARTPIPNLGRQAFLAAYLGRTDAERAARVPTYAAIRCFLYAYQRLRHPQDSARYDDAEAMLAACEHVLAKGLP